MPNPPRWPDGKAFAFTIFDDPDGQTLPMAREVYALLNDLGFRTTKGVWTSRRTLESSDQGTTCDDDPAYIQWLLGLQSAGFEIGFHNATLHTSDRQQTLAGLDRFAQIFGHNPWAMANHYDCKESIYWAEYRLSGSRRLLYNLLTRGRNRGHSLGHIPDHPYFWGDFCRERIKYVRNFVFGTINTLAACPLMPYHDPARPFVNSWYASSEGANIESFLTRVTSANLDSLEADRGACIMYTHFGHGYVRGGQLDPRFRLTMEQLARRNGWFVPVTTLLDFLSPGPPHILSDSERSALERRWLMHKIRFGTA